MNRSHVDLGWVCWTCHCLCCSKRFQFLSLPLSGDILIGLSTCVILSIYLSLSYVHPFLPHPDPFSYVLMFYDDHGLLLFYAIPWTPTYIVYPPYCSVLPL